MSNTQDIRIHLENYQAAILDMDGVITQSASTHRAAWKRMFDEFLKIRADETGHRFEPFTEEEYYQYVDGKPRYEGAQSFLDSRDISISYGSPEDPPGKHTVCGLGNQKNRYFLQHLEQRGVESYASTQTFIRKLKNHEKAVAAISSSRNAKAVLDAADVRHLFSVVVDGQDSEQHHLQGKPEPDIFLEAATRLGVSPENAIVVEDALAGVQAGRAGGFGLVIGVNRGDQRSQLKEHGADIVVNDLSELRI